MVRLKDIAQSAGVSIMTVSKALRDEPDVSPATKGRIKLLAVQMGYVPDSSAQGLRTRTTRLLGLLIPAPTNPIYARIVFAIEERARELGYDLLIAHSLNKPEREEEALKRFLARRVDGLLITPVYRFEAESRIYQEIAARKIPTILLGPPAPFCRQFPSVEIEETLASHNATRHLVQLGHRKIAYLTGPPATPWAHERFEGYRRALREADIEVDDRMVFAAGTTIEDGIKATLQMLNEGIHPTAIQAVSDLVAVGAAETMLAQGFKIPADVSIIGFGNILVAEFYKVPLTTVSQPKHRLGMVAMEAMMNLIRTGVEGNSPARKLVAELVERKSCSPPRPAAT